MANFMVHINDRASYFVEDVENEIEARDIALEWFYEREVNPTTIKLPDGVGLDEAMMYPQYSNDIFNNLCDILKNRSEDCSRSEDARSAYNSALIMILYALHNDKNSLAQFDY